MFPNDPITTEEAALGLLYQRAETAGLTVPKGGGALAVIAITLANLLQGLPDMNEVVSVVNDVLGFLGVDGLLTAAGIAADGTDFQFSGDAVVRFDQMPYLVTPSGLTMPAAQTINLAGLTGTAHWGAWAVDVPASGVCTVTHATYTSGTDQNYATEALAVAALPAVAAGKVRLATIRVQGKTLAAWTTGDTFASAQSSHFVDATPLALPDAVNA